MIGLVQLVAIVCVLVAVVYLAWWTPRFARGLCARRLARSAASRPEWAPEFLEQLLEYARLLDPRSADFEAVCLALAERKVADPRARVHFERYLAGRDITVQNAEIARRLAQLIPLQPVDERRHAEIAQAAVYLDRIADLGLADAEDDTLRAKLAYQWVDVSPPAIAASLRAWRQQKSSSDLEPLARFLENYFAVVWNTGFAGRTSASFADAAIVLACSGQPSASQNSGTLWATHGDFVASAAEVFCATADTPPANLEARRRAIQATFSQGNYRTCFEQAGRARDEFGAPALDDNIWRMWGRALVALESADWPNYAAGNAQAVPSGTAWQRLLEVVDHAAQACPDDNGILQAQVWTYFGAKLPTQRALAVYERAFSRGLHIVPVLEKLAEHYSRLRAWQDLDRVCKVLLTFQKGVEGAQTARWRAEALIEGRLPEDLAVFQRVFDDGPSYPAVNERLTRHYLGRDDLKLVDLQRVERLLANSLPSTVTSAEIQTLRQKLGLGYLVTGQAVPEPISAHLVRYLEGGGRVMPIVRWGVDSSRLREPLQRELLEALVRERPLERRDCLALVDQYAQKPASDVQFKLLAEAAEWMWKDRAEFDAEDRRLALALWERVALSDTAQRALLFSLLRGQPAGWQKQASHFLAQALAAKRTDVQLLDLALVKLFTPSIPDPLHAWCLERLGELRDEPVSDGLRLLALYDAGVGCPDESDEQAREKGQRLAQKLAQRCQHAGVELRRQLFSPLIARVMSRSAASLTAWEIDLFMFGLREGLLSLSTKSVQFADELAATLVDRNEPRAANIQRFAFENGGRTPETAARLFNVAHRVKLLRVDDPYWFNVALLAQADRRDPDAAAFQVDYLLAQKSWDRKMRDVARNLLASEQRFRLAAAFAEHVDYSRDKEDRSVLLALVDENASLGAGRADLLLALAELREQRHDATGALETYLLIEDSVGGSEDLTRRILGVLPDSADRVKHAGRLEEYLKRYGSSFDLFAQMVTLARDPARPLSFGLSYAVVDTWGDLAIKQETAAAGYTSDPSFIVATKCEVYDLYRDQIEPKEAQALLRSIGKHSRQALSDEARKRIENIGDEVLFSSGRDPLTRQLLAELLYNLGNLSASTWHLEQLADSPEQRVTAVHALERIARQLESPRRELPALLAAYRCIAEEAHRSGNTDVAETTVKKAKVILMDVAALDELTAESRKRIQTQQDAILKLYQAILEARREAADLSPAQMRDLADVYRMRGLWDKAGKLYSELANSLNAADNRVAALECAELIFDCYYKAGKGWWDPAARFILKTLGGRETPPPANVADRFGPQERLLLENTAVLYHSLSVDPALKLEARRRSLYRSRAVDLYERLPLEYLQEHEYVGRLSYDLSQAVPTILEPFDLVPRIHERGRTEIWTDARYEKLDRLGSGEFSEVFKVRDTQTDQIYAMKLITPAKGRDVKAVERFQREGAWLKELDHPNIVKCYDAGVQEDRQFIIEDYVDGQTLDDLITRRRRELSLEQRLHIFLSICSAVEFLHNQGILHRDLHPGNVLVGGRMLEVVKLTDFGLATMMDREGIGKSSRIHGRENYTPPEVYNRVGETTASEVFSLGAMLCFLLSGWPRPDAVLLRELKSPAYFGLGEVIERMLSNDPADRYQHVTELIQEIGLRTHIVYDYGAILQKVTPARMQQMFAFGAILGQGDTGAVYRAHDLRRPGAPDVAIKEISSDRVRGSLERRAEHFYRVRDLSHPNVVQLQAFFRVDNKLYVVMDLVEGQSLAVLIDAYEAKGKRFVPETALRIIRDVAQGLAFVHEHRIVHGCVLPTNILVQSASGSAMVSDFAASILFDGDQWHKSALVRQYNYYLAPEIANGAAVTPNSDVYSLGWLLSHITTGQRGQFSSAEIYAALDETGLWSEDLIEKIVSIIERSTVLDSGLRAFKDAGAFLAELNGQH